VPGEFLPFTAEIMNMSDKQLNLKISLKQSIRLQTRSKSKTMNHIVSTIPYMGMVAARSNAVWVNADLFIPPVCATSIGMSRIIQISYIVVLTFQATTGLNMPGEVDVPIVIGTFPIRFQQQMAMPTPAYEPAFALPGMSGSTFLGSNDSTGGGEVLESDEATYKPQYPVFKGLPAVPAAEK
jgi:hypothetical protein